MPFTFTNPLLLLFAAGAVVPLILHWLSRRQRRRVDFSATRFLLKALKRERRRLRIEQWLLLALRMLLPVVIAVALADPAYVVQRPVVTGPPPAHHILLIDATASMTARTDGGGMPGGLSEGGAEDGVFARAKRKAREIVRTASQADAFSVVTLSAEPDVVVAGPSRARSEVLREIQRLEPTHTVGQLATAMRAAVDLGAARTFDSQAAPGGFRPVVHLVSDFQPVTWQAWAEADVQSVVAGAAGAGVRFQTHAVARQVANDAAIISVRTAPALVTQDAEIAVEVTCRGFREQATTVSLLVDGAKIAEQDMELAAGADRIATFRVAGGRPGDRVIEARLPPDPLPVDNERRAVVRVRPPLKALVIEGYPGAGRFIAAALASLPASNLQVDGDVIRRRWLEADLLAPFDVVVTCDVPRFSAGETGALARFIDGGGGLVMMWGPHVDPVAYREAFASSPPLLPLSPLAVSEPGDYFPSSGGYASQIVQPFRGRPAAGLLSLPVWRYWRTQAPANAAATIDLPLDNGDPLVASHAYGDGRVVVVTSWGGPRDDAAGAEESREENWTPLPIWPSFLPLLAEITAWAAGAAESVAATTAGALTTLPRPSSKGAGPAATFVRVIGPHGNLLTGQATGPNADGEAKSDEPDREPPRLLRPMLSGIYTAVYRRGGHEQRVPLAVNPSVRESVPGKAAPPSAPEPTIVSDGPAASADAAERKQELAPRPVSLAAYVLIAVLLLALFESAFARYVGNRTA